MMRLFVLAIVPLLLIPAAFAALPGGDPPPPAQPSADASGSQVQVNASHLPGRNGWFAVPVSVDAPTVLDFEVWHLHHGSPTGAGGSMVLFQSPWDAGALTGGSMRGEQTSLEVSAAGGTIAWNGAGGAGGPASGESSGAMPLEPGEIVWVGLVTIGWNDNDRFYANFSTPDAQIVVGEPLTGSDVSFVDFVAVARRQADVSVVVEDRTVAGQPADWAFDWAPDNHGTGIVAVWAIANGESEASVRIMIDGEPVVPDTRVQDGWLTFGAHRAGTYTVDVSGIRAPQFVGLMQPSRDDLMVVGIFADVELPGDDVRSDLWSYN